MSEKSRVPQAARAQHHAAARHGQDRAQDLTWSRLMAASQGGDGGAYEEVLRSVLPHVRALIRRRGFAGAESEVEDIAQETLLSLHLVRHTYDPARPFSAWISGIVRHRILDHQRKTYRRRTSELSLDRIPETLIPHRNAPQNARDELATLIHAMAGLSPGQRRAVELLKIRGLSLAQAAAESGMSIAALKVAVHRALKSLRLSLACEAA